MKAVVYERYGPPEVLQVREVAGPVPRNKEVLVRVRASTVTPMDRVFRSGENIMARMMSGLLKPANPVPGVEFSGEIESLGEKVDSFRVGEKVFGRAKAGGANAEYVCVPAEEIALNPSNATFEEAAGIMFGGTTALYFLRDLGKIGAGDKVLINGASGGVGSFAVQLAKYFGAEVTGVCSTGNLDLVRSLGSDMLIDYTREDFTKSGNAYDIIFDAVGKRSFSECRSSLSRNGVYLTTIFTIGIIIHMLRSSIAGGKKAGCHLTEVRQRDLVFLSDLTGEGKLKTLIDRIFPLEEISGAHRYADQGHARGKVVITI